MAEVVDLGGKRVETQQEAQDFRRRGVELALGDIAAANDRGEVRSFVGLTVDYQGHIHTTISREFEDDIAFLGVLEVLKSDLLTKLRERREFADTPIPEED